jgi:hypothetical protein
VDEDYSGPPMLHIVVRNIGRGAARDITFDFSAPFESRERRPKHGYGPGQRVALFR